MAVTGQSQPNLPDMSMNILCKGLVWLNYFLTSDTLRNKSENLVEIIPSIDSNGDNTSRSGSLNNKTQLTPVHSKLYNTKLNMIKDFNFYHSNV